MRASAFFEREAAGVALQQLIVDAQQQRFEKSYSEFFFLLSTATSLHKFDVQELKRPPLEATAKASQP